MAVKDWSTTAGSNTNPGGGDLNFQENQLPSTVNNSMRVVLSDLRTDFEDGGWFNYGHSTVFGSGTTFTVASTNVTAIYTVGRRIRAVGSSTGTIYGVITASAFSTNTTVTIVWDSGSLSSETLAISVSKLDANGHVDASKITSGTLPNARLDQQVQDVAGLAVTNGNFIVGDGSNFVAESGATARASMGVTIGTHVQAYSANLGALAGLTSASDKLPYFTGSGSASVTTFTAAGRALLDDANAAAQAVTMAVLPLAGGTLTGALTLSGDPSSNLHPASKQYVDNALLGMGKRGVVRAATTANITIATALNNGDTIDSVELATNDLVLVKNQDTASQNGIYVVQASPARDDLYDTFIEHVGTLIAISEGSTNADHMYLCTADKGGTLDSTAITWTKVTPQTAGTVTSITAGTGLSGGTITSTGTIAATGRLADVAGLAVTNSGVIVGDGSNFVLETGATLRTSLGLGTGDSPQFTAVNIGAASDTTLARSGAGDLTIEGNAVYRAGGTDVPVADGGTGASSLTDGGILLGSGTSAITAMSALAKGSIVAGDGATDPVALAVGTNNYVLTADSGETSGLKWAESAGGNSTLVSTVAAAAQTTISFTGLDSTVAAYEFDLVLHPSADSVYLDMIVGTGSTSYVTSGYGWSNFGNRANSSTYAAQNNTSASSMHIGETQSTNNLGTDAGEGINARVIFIPQSGDASYPRFFWSGAMLGEDAYTSVVFSGSGSVLSATAVTAVQFGLTGAGNFAGGYVTLRSYSKT